jgi:uncharacterized RDD family membrane protein YckC
VWISADNGSTGFFRTDFLAGVLGRVAERFDQLDTAIRMVTPENIAFEYRLAGPFRRLCAYLIDLALRTIFIVSLLFILSMSSPIFQQLFDFGAIGLGMMFVVWFLLDWFYGGTLEALWNGQTPGKWLFGLRVLGVDGQPISGWQAVLRNFLRALDAMPTPWYILGLVTAACNRRFQRLGDLAAGTMVVVEQKAPSIGLIRLTDPEVLELAARLPAKFEANRSLGRALSRYVARRSRFSWRRRCEIAWHLAEPSITARSSRTWWGTSRLRPLRLRRPLRPRRRSSPTWSRRPATRTYLKPTSSIFRRRRPATRERMPENRSQNVGGLSQFCEVRGAKCDCSLLPDRIWAGIERGSS